MDRNPIAVFLFVILLTSLAVAAPDTKPVEQKPLAPITQAVPPPGGGKNLNSSDKGLNNSSNGSKNATLPPPGSAPVNSTPPPSPVVLGNSSGPPLPVVANGTSFPGVVPPGPGNGSAKNGSGNGDGKKDGGGSSGSKSKGPDVVPKCGADLVRCWSGLVACLWHPKNDSKPFLVLQNEGDSALTVTAMLLPSTKIGDKTLAKNSSAKMEIPGDTTKKLHIVLNSGDQSCKIPKETPVPVPVSVPAPVPNFFQQLPLYATQMTPIYGAYAIFLTAIIGAGAWACCRFGRGSRRVDSGLPYQQLEMGGIQPQSISTANANTADVWDQGWDDDWDEEAVSRPSQRQHVDSDSANGHTSKTSNKDGWEDWDD